MQNFQMDSMKMKQIKAHAKLVCKLCGADGHSLGQCSTFANYESKVAHLRELSLCIRCAESGHQKNNCFGKQSKHRYACRVSY